jgi:hypothetical protein
MLRGHGLTRNVTVPVSAGLLTDTNGYFDALTIYCQGDPARSSRSWPTASFAAAANGRQLVLDLRQIRHGWEDKINARRGATAWHLVEVLLRQPVIDTPTVARELGSTPQNALPAITHRFRPQPYVAVPRGSRRA